MTRRQHGKRRPVNGAEAGFCCAPSKLLDGIGENCVCVTSQYLHRWK